MTEALRRLALAICVYAGIWMIAYTRPYTIAIFQADFQRRYQSATRFRESLTFEDYLAAETAPDSTIRLQGPQWEAFHERIRRLLAGGHSDPELMKRMSRGHLQDTLFYDSADPQVGPVAAALNDQQPFKYLEFDGNGASRFLAAALRQAGQASGAPASVVHPLATSGAVLLLLGLGLYILIPWKRSGGGVFRYNRLQGAILPDFLGLILGGVFFALPLLVCTRDYMMARFMVENGYAGITLIALGCSVFGIIAWAVAAHYAAYEIWLLPDKLRFGLLTKVEDYRYEEIEGVELTVIRPPKWLQVAQCLAYLSGKWRAGAAMTAGAMPHAALLVKGRDGRSRQFALTGFSGAQQLLLGLRERRVPVSDEALQCVSDEDEAEPQASALRSGKSAAAWQAVALVSLVLTAALLLQWHTGREKAFLSRPLPTPIKPPNPAAVLAQSRILEQMTTVRAEMQLAVEELRTATGDKRKAALERSVRAQERFSQLHKEFEDLEKEPAGTVAPAREDVNADAAESTSSRI